MDRKRVLFLFALAIPIGATLLFDVGRALAFIYPSPATSSLSGATFVIVIVSFPLTLALIVYYFGVRMWWHATALVCVSAIAIGTPSAQFCAYAIVFKLNEPRYLAAINAMKATAPTFAYFTMREINAFPNTTIIDVVYDEAQQIDLPADRQSVEWKTLHPGFTQQAKVPGEITEVRRLDGNFFLWVEYY